MALTLDQLLIIKTAAECGSFSAAARKLGKAQSTVSSAICNIERETGTVLFERGSKFLRLTAIGQDMLKYINNIIIQTNNLEGRLNACAADIEDNLSITIDAAIPYGFIAPVIREFCKQYSYLPFTTPIDIFLKPVVKGLIRYSGILFCHLFNTSSKA